MISGPPTPRHPLSEQELLALPFEEYLTVCRERAQRYVNFLGAAPEDMVLLEAGWVRRYYLAQVGQWECTGPLLDQ